ncbi:hypothetical protein JD969_09175 [Planctomycetota bacterium]|nr:hypothetical protein JD969_09175 [Planctomycetota bacterium]
MAVYLFTFHAYGSWMPDREAGYVRRGKGVLSKDEWMGESYRSQARMEVVRFDGDKQWLLLDICAVACERLEAEFYGFSCDETHVHVVIGWRDEKKDWLKMRKSMKTAMTKALNDAYWKREWFSKGGGRKQVKDREHFEHLITVYLPKHKGARWGRFHCD